MKYIYISVILLIALSSCSTQRKIHSLGQSDTTMVGVSNIDSNTISIITDSVRDNRDDVDRHFDDLDSTSKNEEGHKFFSSSRDTSDFKRHFESEFEFYPFNIIVPNDPVVKNEMMVDWHRYYRSGNFVNARYFSDVNTHWAGHRDMKGQVMYTQISYGRTSWKGFCIAGEVGSVTGEEFMTLGASYTHYDVEILGKPCFKRVSLSGRFFPDYVIGYEYTTEEFKIFDGVSLSSTGTSRVILLNKRQQMVIQASAWLSFEKMEGFYLGVEYEYNNALAYNNLEFETPHELFFGVKFEIR